MRVMFQLFGLIIVMTLLSACVEDVAPRSSVTIDSSAYYSAFKKSEHESWRIIRANNRSFSPTTMTLTVAEDAPYSAVFVCPSQKLGEATKVYVFHAISSEMRFLDFVCRKSLAEVIDFPVYGKLEGIETADMEHTNGDIVRLALSDEVTLEAWESYAAGVRSGSRDFIGVKGRYDEARVFKQESLLIRRGVSVSASMVPVTMNFSSSNDNVRKFLEASRAEVSITGLTQEDNMEANIGFMSLNKTYINLEKSTNAHFDFLPMPFKNFTGNGTVASNQFRPAEGHVLSVLVKSNDGNVTRKSLKLFTESNDKVHNISLPKEMARSPLITSRVTNELQTIALTWDRYEDDPQGKARLYEWVIKGTAAAYVEGKAPAVIEDNVEWHMTITRGWLSAIGADKDSFIMSLPAYFEGGDKQGEITEHDNWRNEWSFRPDTAVTWQMSVVIANEESTTESLIDYLTNNNVTENLQFSQVYVRSQ